MILLRLRTWRCFLAAAAWLLSLAVWADATTNLDRLADLSLEELMDIEITSVSKRPVKLSQSPAAIQVITRDQIRRSGATTIPQALRLVTNLNIAQQNSREWKISARGFNSNAGNKLLVLIDGRTVYTPLFSGVFWDQQNYLLEDIERIEVISGPGGTLWGTNAVNGVINIITRSAQESLGWYAQAGLGTESEQVVGLRYGNHFDAGVVDDGAVRVYGKFFERGPEHLSNGTEGNEDWRMGQVGFRMDASAGASDTLTLQGDYYRNRTDNRMAGNSEAEGANLLTRWTHTIDAASAMYTQIYYSRAELSLPVGANLVGGTAIPAGTFRDQLDTIDLDFHHHFPFGKRQRVVWGVGFRHTDNAVDNAPGLAFYPDTLKQHLYSAFVQNETSLVPETLVLMLGTKFEHNDYTGGEWEPNVRLLWNVADNHMLWAAISRAVRMPSRIDRDFAVPAQGYPEVLRGGTDFDSETVTAYELGYRTELKDALAVSLSGFYNNYDNLRSVGITPVTITPLVIENNVEGTSYGFELSFSYQAYSWWNLRGGYNFLEEALQVKAGEFDQGNARAETADPKHQLSLYSSVNVWKQLELDIALRWVDELPTNSGGSEVDVPDYAELDLRLGWHPGKNLELSLVGQNLLHDQHQEFGVPMPTQEEVGRNFVATVQWRY